MAHNCIDWTTSPPTRKIPILILTRGDDHVYTTVPKELKTLEEAARREFDLGDVEIKFSSSCLNLCNGLPARITESTWEHISPYIGCVVVEVSGPRAVPPQDFSCEEQPTVPENIQDERDSSVKQKLSSNTDEGDGSEQHDRGPSGEPNTLARDAFRDERSATSDHGNDEGASAPEDQHEEPWEEEVSAILPRKPRNRRRVVSEDEDGGEGEDEEREHEVSARSQVPPIASPPKPTQASKKERDNDYRSQRDLQPAESLHQPSRPIKQEKRESGSGSRSYSHDGYSQSQHTETQYEARTQAQAESSENQKLMIRVAHRPSKQESKFTTKGTTKVAKVLTGACKSFGLDASRATMYLIVSVEDEDGEVDNLFPCDKNDTIARAGAEHDTESRFLLKIAGEEE